MTDEEIQQFLAMGGSEEEIQELLRQKERQEGILDSQGGYDPTVDAGRYVVPNFADPLREAMSSRKAKKEIGNIEGKLPNMRRKADEDAFAYMRAAMGKGLGGVDLHADVPVTASGPMPIKPMPQVPSAPMAGPEAPPAAGPAGPSGPAPLPAPEQPQAPAPAPQMPQPSPYTAQSGSVKTRPEFADIPGLPGMTDDEKATQEILAMLRQSGGR